MQRAYFIFILFVIQLIAVQLYAQRVVSGLVIDSLGAPMSSVNIRLIADNDTSSTFTSLKGEFIFTNVRNIHFILAYSMMGYKAEISSHYFLEGKQFLQLPVKTLKPINTILPSANVVRVAPMLINGDTIQFNFAAYNFHVNSLLEEALKDLPGFQVYRDGSVTYNGTQIRRVRVGNKDFFGGDLLNATRNLPAEFIKNIQLINSSTIDHGNTGILSEDDDKVLNINLKEDRQKIYFGQAALGGGTNHRYVGNVSLNKFDKGQEISLLGSFNNTNSNVFTFGNPFGGSADRNNLDLGIFNDPIDGLNKVNSLGVNLTDRISEVVSFSGGYNYINTANLTKGNSQMTSSYIDNTIFRKEDYTIKINDKIHKIKLAFDMNFKNKDVLTINSNMSYSRQFANQNRESNINNTKYSSLGRYQDSSYRTSPNLDMDFLYSKYFEKKGRKLIGHWQFRSNTNKLNSYIDETYYESEDNSIRIIPGSFKEQLILQNNNSRDNKLNITYVEPFTSVSRLEVSYDYELTSIDAFRQVDNRLDDNTYRLIDSLSVDYSYLYSSHKGSMVYQFEPNNKMKMNIGFAVQPLVLKGYLPLRSTSYNYENVNLIPTANFIYKFSTDTDWQLNYQGKNNQPYFSQIAPVIDNSDSRNVLIGNPELKSEYSHRISTKFRKSRPFRMQYFETNFAYNFVLDKIVSSKKTLASSTRQETSYQNTKGYYDWRFYYTFQTPFISEDIQLDLTGTADYYHNLSYIDERKRTTNQLLINQALEVKYDWSEYLESLVYANYLWNQARYDIPFKTKIDVKNMFLGLGVKGHIKSLTVGLDMSQRFNDGYKNSLLNVSQTLLNSYLEFDFLRNKSAFLRLQVNDLFGQNKNSGIVSEYIGNNVYEARNNRLGRYIMLSLNVRLQKLPN